MKFGETKSGLVDVLFAWGHTDPTSFYISLVLSVFGIYYSFIAIGQLASGQIRRLRLHLVENSGEHPVLSWSGLNNFGALQALHAKTQTIRTLVSRLLSFLKSERNLSSISLILSLISPPVLVAALVIIVAQITS